MAPILLDCTIKGLHSLSETSKVSLFARKGEIYRADVLRVKADGGKKKEKERKINT